MQTERPRFLASSFALALGATLTLGLGGCAGDESEEVTSSSEEQDLVGGEAETRYQAVGYLSAVGSDEPLCGATLIAPNVAVTAAHCAHRNRDEVLQFGVGEVSERRRTLVRSVHEHPKAHLEREGTVDLVHTLLLFDVAYLLLDEPIDDVVPAALSTDKPRHGDDVRLVAYGPLGSDAVRRKGVRGTVVLNAKLAGDTIVEIAPRGGGAVCHRDGDEGHAAIVPDEGGDPVLVGLYVGSVTQSFSDCRKYLQYLNGYEATFGFVDFYREGIEAGRRALEGEPIDPSTCDPELFCGQALSCVEGRLYPTVCGPANCDEPIGDCGSEEPSCDPERICAQALSCVDGKQYPTVCGPANCDEPIGDCGGDPG